jgi:hypothetical protein
MQDDDIMLELERALRYQLEASARAHHTEALLNAMEELIASYGEHGQLVRETRQADSQSRVGSARRHEAGGIGCGVTRGAFMLAGNPATRSWR